MTEPQPAPEQPRPVWARPVEQVEWVDTEPLEYHRLLRGAPRYRWWKPLVAVLLAALYYLTLSVVFGLAVMLPYFAVSGEPLTEEAMFAFALPDTQNPATLIMALGSVVLMIPAAWLGMLSVGLKPGARLWSVALRIRWRWIGRTILPAIVTLIVMNGVAIIVELMISTGADAALAEAEPTMLSPDFSMQAALWSALLIVLLVPFQATAEELVFRGLLMQTFGAWVRSPWLAIIAPTVLFGFAHIYDVWGFGAVVAIGLAAALLAWRTGGLEAAITIHVLNNWVAFGFMLVGAGGETGMTSSGGGPGALIGTVVGMLLYVLWVDRDFARRDGRRTRIDIVERRQPAERSSHVA